MLICSMPSLRDLVAIFGAPRSERAQLQTVEWLSLDPAMCVICV